VAVSSPSSVRRRRRFPLGTTLRFAVAVAGAIVMVFPIYWMFVTAVTPVADLRAATYSLWPSSIHLRNFQSAWNQLPFGKWFINSFVIAIAGVLVTVSINVLCGYTFAKLRFPLRGLLFALIVSTLVIPIQVLIVPQFQLVIDFGWLDSRWGVIIPRAAEAFGIFLARQYFLSVPDELLEAARIDGASEFRIFWRVVLPLAKPLIAVLVIFTFMWRWNEFAWPLIVLKDQASYTVPVGLLLLRGQYSTDYNHLMAMTLVSLLPMLVIFLLFQRYFVEGVARSGLK
jgi:ABC-type glycerol-3-phosphate transport system permease component